MLQKISLLLPLIEHSRINSNLDKLFNDATKSSKYIEKYLEKPKLINNQKERQHIILNTYEYILKIFSLDYFEHSSNNLKYEFMIYKILQKLDSYPSYIIPLIDLFKISDINYLEKIFLELKIDKFNNETELYVIITVNKIISEFRTIDNFSELELTAEHILTLLLGLKEIHELGIIHNDCYLKNILAHKNDPKQVYYFDFDCSFHYDINKTDRSIDDINGEPDKYKDILMLLFDLYKKNKALFQEIFGKEIIKIFFELIIEDKYINFIVSKNIPKINLDELIEKVKQYIEK